MTSLWREPRSLLAGLLLVAGLALTCWHLYQQFLGHNAFALQEWLIGYPDAFVRRGAGGELLWGLERLTGLPMLVWVAGLSGLALRC